MQLPQYTRRVGPQAPMPALPPVQDSAYEGVIRFSEEVKRTSNVLSQLALDNERRVRAQTMQAEQASAWKAWSEAKAAYQETFFAPDTAYVVEEGHDVPNYVRGLQEFENFESKFWEETQEGFTYSEAMNNFRQRMEQDRVGFENTLKTAGRDMHLDNLRNILQTTVDDLVDQGDAEGVRDELAAAAENGLISPMEYRDIGDASLRNIAYREVHLSARNLLQSTGDLEAALDDLDEHEGIEWEDMSGETQRLTLRQREELRSNLIQEDNRMRAAKKRREDEADRVGDEEAQRLHMRGDLTLDMLRDQDHEQLSGMYVSTREYWRKAIERENALAAGAGMAQDELNQRATYAELHSMIEDGLDYQKIRELIHRAFVNGHITEPNFNTLNTRNRSRTINNTLQDGTKLIRDTARELGLSQIEAQNLVDGWHQRMLDDGYFIRTDDGRTLMNPEFRDHSQLMQIAYNMTRPVEINKIYEDVERQQRRRLATGAEQDRHWATRTQWKIDNVRFLGVDPNQRTYEVLNRLEAEQSDLFGREIGAGPTSVIVDPDTKRRIYVVEGARRPAAASGAPSYAQASPVRMEFTYRVEDPQTDEDGQFVSGRNQLYVKQNGDWVRVRESDLDGIRTRLGIEPVAQRQPLRLTPSASARTSRDVLTEGYRRMGLPE